MQQQNLLQTIVYQQVRWVTRLASDTAVHSVVWSISAGYRCELSCVQLNGECQFYAKSHELIDAFLACSPDWAQGFSLLCDKRGLTLLKAGQLYPSCGFPSADCRCFKVFNPCRAIHTTAFVHHTALTDRDVFPWPRSYTYKSAVWNQRCNSISTEVIV